MKVLVVGSGGREHALCWKLSQSDEVEDLYAAPGNPGIAAVADLVPIASDEIHQLADFASDLKIDLTVVGPELPLTLGIVDEFNARGLPIFGPRAQAAELEGSKVFAKEFMKRHGIPTAKFVIAHELGEARRAALDLGLPVVLKADGLAAGKGVLIPTNRDELERALSVLFVERRFGAAGERVVVEEFLEGEEVSFMAFSDGERVLPLATSKDYKRLGDGDQGPNTGGMGCHSPSGVLRGEEAAEVLDQIVRPTIRGMADENRQFVGTLYVGLILTPDGPRVLEYNVRLGDPEAQALLPRIESDLIPVFASAARGRFETSRLHFRKEAVACVVLCSRGYPESPEKGEVIEGLDDEALTAPGIEVFHAATAKRGDRVVTAGGRVISVCASGAHLRDALRSAYAAAARISWPGKIMRHDIGKRVLAGESSGSSKQMD